MERQAGVSHYVGRDEEAEEIKKTLANSKPNDQSRDQLVVVCGYGRIGKVSGSSAEVGSFRGKEMDRERRRDGGMKG